MHDQLLKQRLLAKQTGNGNLQQQTQALIYMANLQHKTSRYHMRTHSMGVVPPAYSLGVVPLGFMLKINKITTPMLVATRYQFVLLKVPNILKHCNLLTSLISKSVVEVPMVYTLLFYQIYIEWIYIYIYIYIYALFLLLITSRIAIFITRISYCLHCMQDKFQ